MTRYWDNPEVPFDPDSPIFNTQDPNEVVFGDLTFPTINDAIFLPEIDGQKPRIGDIVGSEARAFIELVENYGLPAENLARLEELLLSPDKFTFISGLAAGEQAGIGETEAFIRDVETGVTDIYLAPNMIRNFITDAMHTIEPVGGDQEISFARDAGVRMACTYALTILCFEFLRQQTAVADSQSIDNLYQIGHEDVPQFDSQGYADFLPHRMAARLAIDRLVQSTSEYYLDEGEGLEAAENYAKIRQKSFEVLRLSSLGKFSFIDMATVLPLSVAHTQEFFTRLPGVVRNPNDLQPLD